jgi:hypothetical protein
VVTGAGVVTGSRLRKCIHPTVDDLRVLFGEGSYHRKLIEISRRARRS